MLRKIRIALAALFFVGITLLFLDFTGTIHFYLGWMAKVQLLPAVLAGNFIIVGLLLLVTLLVGRVYCSVVCPLGVMQDCFSFLGKKTKVRKLKYTKGYPLLRYVVLALFVLLMVFGLNSIAVLIAPYSAYGRIATELFQPVYRGLNNLFAFFAERADSYAFYSTEVWVKSGVTLAVAIVTFLLVGFLSFRWGRLWCNTVCPVGTVLGLVSRFAIFRPRIDASKCVGCRKCEMKCKAQCINIQGSSVDTSRCVACMDCIDTCPHGAIKLGMRNEKLGMRNEDRRTAGGDCSRRKFLATTAAVGAAVALQAQEKSVDGGLAVIEDKQIPERKVPLKPFGARSLKHFSSACTACQLCVSECPHHVLRPSTSLATLMQPEMAYDRGFCHPDCTRCSQVCPTGAIRRTAGGNLPADTVDEESRMRKSAISIGYAVPIPENCLLSQGINCNACSRHCPTGAIKIGMRNEELGMSGTGVVAVNENACIGCGACEYYCPVRPFAAIYVEGREVHTAV